MPHMSHDIAEKFVSRRRDAMMVGNQVGREALLRQIMLDEDPYLGSDEKLEGVRMPYNPQTK